MAAAPTDKKTSADGGFDEGYNYGYEHVDLSLKTGRQLQKSVIVLRDVAAVHNESSSISRDDNGDAVQRRRANTGHFKTRFGAWVEHKCLGREAPPEDLLRAAQERFVCHLEAGPT